MTTLTVVTLTRSLGTKTLGRCKESVQAALVPGVKHVILVCPREEFHTGMRYESARIDDYTTIVDDDDVIEADSLSKCMRIINDNELDMLFTDEVIQIEQSGVRYESMRGRRTFASIATTPLSAHNLCILKSSAIDPRSLQIANRHGIGIEWLMRASVAMTGKVGHLPEPLYTWYQHPGQHSKVYMKKFNACFPSLRKNIGDTWGIKTGDITQYR